MKRIAMLRRVGLAGVRGHRSQASEVRAVPAQDEGNLTILRTPGIVAFEGSEPHLAHPLLVYSEMLASPEPRMREAAQEIRERFLPEAA